MICNMKKCHIFQCAQSKQSSGWLVYCQTSINVHGLTVRHVKWIPSIKSSSHKIKHSRRCFWLTKYRLMANEPCNIKNILGGTKWLFIKKASWEPLVQKKLNTITQKLRDKITANNYNHSFQKMLWLSKLHKKNLRFFYLFFKDKEG